MMKRDLPSPDQILEELADKVALQIDRLAAVSFDNALREMTRYHRFLLSVNASRDPSGTPFSYAEVPGNAWHAPHREWIRQYRRLFERAADRIPDDTRFMRSLAHVANRLLPRSGDPALSAAVLQGILDLGPLLIHRLEGWVTKRTVLESSAGEAAKPRLTLAGSDAKAYADVLTEVVGSWERLLQAAPSLFEWREEGSGSEHRQWAAYRVSWPYLWQHLQNTAYALAVAVWNEDELGSVLFRDALVRWPETLSYVLKDRAELRHRRLLFPNVLTQDWEGAVAQVGPLLYDYMPKPAPGQLFAAVVRRAHDDAVLMTAGLLLHWTTHNKQASDIGGRTAGALLRREQSDPNDMRLGREQRELTLGSLLLDLISLELAGESHEDGTYGAELDQLVVTLDNMTERRVVPGRVFTPSTLHSRDELLLSFLTILTAAEPDNGLQADIGELISDESVLPRGDRSIRGMLRELRQYEKVLEQPSPQIQHGVAILKPGSDVNSATEHVRMVLIETIAAVEAKRHERLIARAVEAGRLERLRAAIEAAILKEPPHVPFFRDVQVNASGKILGELKNIDITGMSKAQLLDPSMEDVGYDLDEHLSSRMREWVGQRAWNDFCRRERQVVAVDHAVEDEAFWSEVRGLAAQVGPDPLLVVSRQAEGRALRHLIYRRPNERSNLKVQDQAKDAVGGSYIATVEGVDVCSADFKPGTAWLFSALALHEIRYGALDAEGHHISLSFEPDADGLKGTLRAVFNQQTVWADLPVFELKIHDPEEDSAELD